MTVNKAFYNWVTSGLEPGAAPYNRCAPALDSILNYLVATYGGKSLGCFGVKEIPGKDLPSAHSFGAALDWRYKDPGPGRRKITSEVIPFLIENSKELEIQAIHDYFGSRIWRANRSGDDAGGWRDQPASTSTGMGQKWAHWLHLEVTRAGWADGRTVPEKLGIAPPPPPPSPFDPANGKFGAWPSRVNKPTIRRGANGDAVKYLQGVLRKCRYQVTVDGVFAAETDDRLRRFQRQNKLTVDGVCGPRTWAVIDERARA